MAILPGTLPLSITRGIAFPGVILQCKDEGVSVTGTLSPNVVGTFVITGQFGGYDLYVLSGTPSTFLYYNAASTSYVIARILTTAALTDYWVPAAPITVANGTYVAHGANSGTATADLNPIDLTDFTPKAEVKRKTDSQIILDLNPSVTDAVNGEITIPAMTSNTTQDFEDIGTFNWDLVLVNNSGERVAVIVKGNFVVTDNITQPVNT